MTLRRIASYASLVLGFVLFAVAVAYTDFSAVLAAPGRFAIGFALAVVASAAWHAVRTWMWSRCFARPVPFWQLAGVRMAGEAFSYLTLSGIAGDPLKWAMLRDQHGGTDVAASLARERIGYLIGTAACLCVAAIAVLEGETLTGNWTMVFRIIAITCAIAVVAPLTIVVVRRREPWPRLIALALGSAAAFACMVAEAWCILAAAGLSPGIGPAIVIETVSRSGTFAGVFVPANLGVLELSTLSAALAIGVPAAAAPLAITRRLRGLFWAAVGLLLYLLGRARAADTARTRSDGGHGTRVLLYVAATPASRVSPLARIAGLPIAERVVRRARRDGYDEIVVAAGADAPRLRRLEQFGGVRVETSEREIARLRADPAVTIVEGPATASEAAALERVILAGAFKPTDAKVARFNRRISLPISLALLRTPITANHVSAALVALGFWSAWLFSRGDYLAAALGGAVSLAASILDGCDGEIARLKYQESALGCWLETFGDYSYYIALLAGITLGTVRSTGWQWLYPCAAAALAGTLVSFAMLVFLRHRITNGSPDQLHAIARDRFTRRPTIWSRVIWRVSFVATRAAMPYGIFVLALLNALPLVIVLWAIGANVYWASLTLKMRDLLVSDWRPAPRAADRGRDPATTVS